MALTKVSPSLFQISNNITSVTVGGSANTISLTFDGSGVITSATNNAISVANTAITGNIISSQITSVANTQLTGNIISSQISPSVTLTTPIISGNLNLDSAGTTGIRVPSANTITFHTAGTEDVRIDSSGNMGIGITPPAWSGFKVLDVGSVTSLWAIGSGAGTSYYSNNLYYNGSARIYKNTGEASEYTQGGGSHQFYVAASGNAGNTVSLTKAMEINSSRQFGFAGTVGGNFGSQSSFFNPGSYNFSAEFNTAVNSNIVLWQRTETYPCTQIQFYGFNGAVATNAGSVTLGSSTSTSYNTSSDYRMKENVQPMTSSLSKVALLKPVTYKWKEEFGGKDGQGFIAHELQEVFPEAVVWEKDAIDEKGDPKYQGVDTSFLVATLTAAIQELKVINDSQSTSIATLTATATSQAATITALTARVVALES